MTFNVQSGSNWNSSISAWIQSGSAWHEIQNAWIQSGSAWHQFWVKLNAPTNVAGSDASICDEGSPDYKITITWTNSNSSIYPTRIYIDGSLSANAAAGTTSIDVSVAGEGTYEISTIHYTTLFGGTIQSIFASGSDVIVVNPCGV